MITYQDLQKVGESERDLVAFVYSTISTHKNSEKYLTAKIANDYAKQQNTTICEYQKVLYDLRGKEVADKWSANYKLPSNFFNRFITQENQYLLGNGVTWENKQSGTKLGEDFDAKLQTLGKYALIEGVGFGFWNYDHLEVFRLTEFAPLWDEEDGGLKAGIRFWQIDKSKPQRATLYEIDGYTNFMWTTGNEPESAVWHRVDGGVYMTNKQKYKLTLRTSPADGVEIIDGENYPTFPVVPLWGNPAHQSEIVGIRPQIDAYDLIKSGFANDLDNAQIYWILHNTGGMDDVDLAEFLRRIRSVGAAMVDSDDGVAVETHTLEIPSTAREELLNRLRNDLYEDAMALDVKQISAGNTTATEIIAAYEPLNAKTDQYEYCVLDFLQGIMELAGVDDNPTFRRSTINNASEDIQNILLAGEYLPQEYITRRVLTILGDGDQFDEVQNQMINSEIRQFTNNTEEGEV